MNYLTKHLNNDLLRVLDKDGIFSAVRMAELLAYLKRQGKTLLQLLDDLYDRQASYSHVTFTYRNITFRF